MATTFTNFLYHVVFSTKERRPMISAPIRSELYPYLGGIIRDKDGILLEIGGTADHVHILAKLKQHIAIADILRELKANSSKFLNERPDLGQWYGWQTGYGAFTVSASQVSRVR
ncbi:MAG: IS200/IS605 family transposase, partial [Planctomycetes bacterium]|nr:IS200/IS605 family transposase [Planctomycetota bacterium]